MGARLYPNDVVFGEAWPIHGNPMCCVPTIEVQSSMATKDGSISESFPTVKVSVQKKKFTLNHRARKTTTDKNKKEKKKESLQMLSECCNTNMCLYSNSQ